ncbi:MAG TPA: glycoside hydrolase family 16 protein [Chryseolinea sp.]|nr:glycoside hydrolase family 16 protein [Chryseolinea sp.]
MKSLLPKAIVLSLCLSAATVESPHKSFREDFDGDSPKHFSYASGGNQAAFTRTFGVRSSIEPGTSVLSFKIDPNDPPGAGRGPEIISNDFTHYGKYSARIKVPDARSEQPNVGAVVGYFTYHMDDVQGLSEIDFEWLIADPSVIYVGTWTGPEGALKRIGRTINLADGTIHGTSYREGHQGVPTPLTGLQNQPETIKAIDGYDASSQFHIYGFDWHRDHLRWWMLHPVTSDTVVLWDYRGSQRGIPQNESRYRLNFWHTNEWSVVTNPSSLEKPLKPYELEVDWMMYDGAADEHQPAR